MIKVLAVVALMTVAQLIPSCGNDARTGDDGGSGSRAQVIGWIDEKRQRHYEFFPYMIVINGQEYGVPYDFYLEARVGDLVKYDGEKWTFVRRAGR